MIVRFAPSPTNQNEDVNNRGLHIGSLRTILFNYLFAKQNNYKFICRIEDTDEERSNDDCLRCMIRDWEWAGIQFDAGFKINNNKIEEFNNTGDPLGSLRQSQRKHLYQTCAAALLKDGKAYEKDGAIYFKMPQKEITFYDAVLGELTLPAKDCQDFVIIKKSGMPSFYMAVTCDDALMQVGMIIRGFEHVNTNFRQVALQEALGFPRINTAHIPLIFNPDGTKMSKRQKCGQVNVWDFRNDGYLPQGLLNYISMLGWNPGKNQEYFDMDFMIKNFSLKNINKNNARFDYKKLDSVNHYHTKMLTKPQLGHLINCDNDKILNSVHSYILPRCKTLKAVKEQSEFIIKDTVSIDIDLMNKIDFSLLQIAYDAFKKVTAKNWTKDSIMNIIHSIIQNHQVAIGQLSMSIRVAITGKNVSPPIDDTLVMLGKKRSLDRMKNACNFNKVMSEQYESSFNI